MFVGIIVTAWSWGGPVLHLDKTDVESKDHAIEVTNTLKEELEKNKELKGSGYGCKITLYNNGDIKEERLASFIL